MLPWKTGTQPLMLAPMQGLTNDALRACYLEHYRPDVVFTEFVRVHTQSRKRVARSDLSGILAHDSEIPLVVQLIGNSVEALCAAAQQLEDAGCRHLNLNLGCPYGRMTTGATGGELLREPVKLAGLLKALRKVIRGSFSVKCRSGYAQESELFDLLPVYTDSGLDYLILHPRTVLQKYGGRANHALTAEAADRLNLPVIANGDIAGAGEARRILSDSRVAGLMLGRGALADPWLFERIRGRRPADIAEAERWSELHDFIMQLLPRYLEKFCGERQALMKLKDLLNFIPDENLQRDLGKLKRATSVVRFEGLLKTGCKRLSAL